MQRKISLSPYLFNDLTLSISWKVSLSNSMRLGYCQWFALAVTRNDYIFVYNRPLWISSRDICIIYGSQ